jgi:hypothetical protein
VAALERVAVELPSAQAERTYGTSAADALVGAVVLAPVAVGDLLLRSSAGLPPVTSPGVSVSFPVASERAFAGRLGVGERVDLLVTADGDTSVVARGVLVADVVGDGAGLGGASLVLTVLVPDLAGAQVVLHAADTGRIAVVRGADPDEVTGQATTSVGTEPVVAPEVAP